MKLRSVFGILTGLAVSSFALTPAWAQVSFYEGKTITGGDRGKKRLPRDRILNRVRNKKEPPG